MAAAEDACCPQFASAAELSAACVDASPTPAPVTVLQAYARKAAELRRAALDTGSVHYGQVIAVAYDSAMVTDEVLRAKAAWRAAVRDGFEFVSDYALSTSGATVHILTALPDPGLHSTLVAQYEATSHVIGISNDATDFAIFHEAGHALQRATLSARGTPAGLRARDSDSFLDRVLRAVRVDNTSARRLKYLCSQDEFEVRLQDLNRFHALLVAGRPIMNPGDSVRALAALGMPLEFDAVQRAFRAGEQELSRAQFDDYASAPLLTGGPVAVAFEDARELLLLRTLALRVDEALWQQMLAKIIFEAPGHL